MSDTLAEIVELGAFSTLTMGGSRMVKSWNIEPHIDVSAILAGAMSFQS